jgi:hypothetical protein
MDVLQAKEIVLEYLSSVNISDRRVAEDNEILNAIVQNPNDSLTVIKRVYENIRKIGGKTTWAGRVFTQKDYDNAYAIIKAILVPKREQPKREITQPKEQQTTSTQPEKTEEFKLQAQTEKKQKEKEFKLPYSEPESKFNPLYLFLPLLTLIGIIFALKFRKR